MKHRSLPLVVLVVRQSRFRFLGYVERPLGLPDAPVDARKEQKAIDIECPPPIAVRRPPMCAFSLDDGKTFHRALVVAQPAKYLGAHLVRPAVKGLANRCFLVLGELRNDVHGLPGAFFGKRPTRRTWLNSNWSSRDQHWRRTLSQRASMSGHVFRSSHTVRSSEKRGRFRIACDTRGPPAFTWEKTEGIVGSGVTLYTDSLSAVMVTVNGHHAPELAIVAVLPPPGVATLRFTGVPVGMTTANTAPEKHDNNNVSNTPGI